MRLNVVSDLHVDIAHNGWTPPNVDCDVVVVAGDTRAPATLALRWMRETAWPDKRIVYVMGNHDFYSDHRSPETKTTWEAQRAEAPGIARDLGIDLLDDGIVVIDGVRFIGSTLWSDFQQRPPHVSHADAVRQAVAGGGMNDYRMIKTGAGRSRDMLRPRDTIEAHKAARRFIEQALVQPFDGETVVVTHHAPLPSERLRDLDWCYRSDLTRLMDGDHAPALWLHGHTHGNVDCTVGRTRIVCNPRGYPAFPRPNAARENPSFNPELVVEVGVKPEPEEEATSGWRM